MELEAQASGETGNSLADGEGPDRGAAGANETVDSGHQASNPADVPASTTHKGDQSKTSVSQSGNDTAGSPSADLNPSSDGKPNVDSDASAAKAPEPPDSQEADDVADGQSTQQDDNSGGGGRRRGRRGNNAQVETKVVYIPPPTAPSARPRRRHWAILFSFFLVVLAPFAVAAWYLFEKADDQYASTLGFSVRKQEATSNFEDIGSAFGIGNSGSSDTDVLYEFIQSQAMVSSVDGSLGLRAIWSKAKGDPVFAIKPDASIEELVDYWQRMVTIFYDAGSGLIEVRVLAFDPQDAQKISQAIFDESSEKINALSAIARADSTRYARDDLEAAERRWTEARAALTAFRARTQIADPNSQIQIQVGILGSLNEQLTAALIDLDTIQLTAREGDPRIRQMEQRIEVIENRIAQERRKFGIGETDGGNDAFASLVNEYEELVANVEFAGNSYNAALTNYNAAVAEATRQSRYLAPHIPPTLAQSSEYPRRLVLLGVLGLLLFMTWAIATMLYYSVKDRR